MTRRIEEMTVGEVMTKSPITAHPRTKIRDVKNIFAQHEYNSIPVVEEDGTLRGVVTKLDLLRMFRPDRRSLIPDINDISAEFVEEIMSRGYVDVQAKDSVVSAIDLMIELNLRSLPVTEAGKDGRILRGIVTRKDVLRCFIFDDDE
jgi:CBS domain-containing protein